MEMEKELILDLKNGIPLNIENEINKYFLAESNNYNNIQKNYILDVLGKIGTVEALTRISHTPE